MRKLLFFTTCILGFVLSTTTHASRTALVIGNSHYADAPLKNPTNDAQDIATALRLLDFEVLEYLNVNRKEMRKAIREFSEKLEKTRGVGLFYFAGHGLQIDGNNYLLPIHATIDDADDVYDEGVNIKYALDKMEDSKNRLNIVILDACRNNPFQKEFRSLERGLTRVRGPKGSFISFATSPGDVADDGNGRNGVFTQHVLDHLMNPASSLEEVFKEVRKTVDASTVGKQLPWDNSSVKGSFHFFDKKKWKDMPSIEEQVIWDAIKDTGTSADFNAFITRFPNSAYTVAARFKIELLSKQSDSNIVYGQVGNSESKLSDILLNAQSLLIKRSLNKKNLGEVYLLYKDAASLSPDNPKVKELRSTLIDAYSTLAKETIEDGDEERAQKVFQMIVSLDKNHSQIEAINEMLKSFDEGKNVSMPSF